MGNCPAIEKQQKMEKNRNPKITLFSLTLLLFTACVEQSKTPIEEIQQTPSATKQNYFLTSTGDNIPTGVPITIKGKLLNPDSFTAPVTTPFTFKPRIAPAKTNVHTVGPPKIVPVPKKLTVITPGKSGIPLPKRIAGSGTILPIERTQSVRALAPKMKESATSNIQYWDIEEGLTYSIIRSLLQDRRGHLWIGTRDYGVSRFDGQYFTHFTGQSGETIAPLSMVEDIKGRIWMGSRGGLTRYDGTDFIQYKEEDGLNDNYIRWLTTDSNNNLWIGTQRNGLSHFQLNENGQGGYFTQYTTEVGLSHSRVNMVMEDKEGIIWLCTQKGLNRFDGEKFTHYTTEEGLSHNIVEYILEDRKGHLWIGTRNGLNRFDGQHFYQYTIEQGLTSNYIWTLFEDSEGRLWAGTFDGGGLMRFHPDENGQLNQFTHYSTANGLNEDWINRILEDDAHNLWIGLGRNGINRLNESHFTHYPSIFISAIAQNTKGHIWFSSTVDGLLRYDGENWNHIGKEEGLPGNIIQSGLIDSQDNLWIKVAGHGLYRFNLDESGIKGALTNFSQPGGLPRGITNLLEDSQGNYWMTSLFNGVYRYDGINFINFSPAEGLPSRLTLGIFEDSKRNIWIRMGEHGLMRFTPNAEGIAGSFTLFTRAEGMSSHFVSHIFEDSQGHLWFATNGGLNYFDGQRFIPFTIKEGLNHNIVQAIIEDKQQNIWISTYKGINLLTPKANAVDSINTSLLEKYTVHNLGKEDGLNDLRFINGSVHLDQENKLWWGHYGGITKIDLNTFKFSDTPPKIGLKTIEIGGNFIDYRQLKNADYQNTFPFGAILSHSFDSVAQFENYPINLRLPHDLNHLTFHFYGIDWTAPHKIKYSYKIEGLDQNWTAPKSEPIADYRNIPYGAYTLKVRASGAAQEWSEPFDYAFTIRPPWWHTWWARLLYVLTGGLLLYALFQWRTFNLRAQQKQLEATVTQRTAEVVEEQKRSDELLLNILPATVAEELKQTGQAKPVTFEEVSILFADFKGFTNIVASIPGKELVSELNEMFQHFDDIVADLGIEKIQTIGDAYLAACGLPNADADHAIKCVQAGQQMIAYLNERNQKSSIKWEIRIGIHSGPITAGIVGKRKFAYDLFGDSINIAARIESAGEAGKINVSAYTHKLIKHQFPCAYRGKINAKGKGNLDMYFVG